MNKLQSVCQQLGIWLAPASSVPTLSMSISHPTNCAADLSVGISDNPLWFSPPPLPAEAESDAADSAEAQAVAASYVQALKASAASAADTKQTHHSASIDGAPLSAVVVRALTNRQKAMASLPPASAALIPASAAAAAAAAAATAAPVLSAEQWQAKLHALLCYVRDTFFYCHYCGIKVRRWTEHLPCAALRLAVVVLYAVVCCD